LAEFIINEEANPPSKVRWKLTLFLAS